jgi:hypothetical protein
MGGAERSGQLEGGIADASADAGRENGLPGAETGLTKRGERAQVGHRQTGRVADIGLQLERRRPGGTSFPAIAMIGAT